MAGIYIHIPFCKKACHYCDFHFSTSLQYKQEILEAIGKEIKLQKNYLGQQIINTIYIGGGTPSVLSGSDLSKIIASIQENFNLAPDAEITIEANPDDLNNQKIKEIKQTAINRFSIGVQSFFDNDLKWMNRAHQATEAEAAIKRAQDNGFTNINIDLIYGFPLLSQQKWETNLQKAINYQVPHISAYALTVEPKTALAAFINTQKQAPINDEQSTKHFLISMDTLCQAGYKHYEISNFSLLGMQSRHNTNYWKGVHYLGIGPSAHSYNGYSRQWNLANNVGYLSALAKHQIPHTIEQLTTENLINEFIMINLRTHRGINLDTIGATFGTHVIQHILNQAQVPLDKGLIQINNNTITLSRTGKLYADAIAADLFVEENFKR
ncbi:MAG: radical SAM family heme chaperone HemW [Sphingobacteriales bacterium]|nr:MAG: radical SAM family heme chaperone HemW [Sphingobacteriales bacterium]TAF79369.1 MAG: radical SAM family heme chaperone HemW [Sphingobacteriales bacterium]